MTPQQIQLLYFVVFALYLVTELVLLFLNIGSINKNAAEVPRFFKDHVDAETYAKAVSYSSARAKFSIFSTIYTAASTILFLFAGWFAAIWDWAQSLGRGELTTGVIFLVVSSFAVSLAGIPLSLYTTFVIEQRFGFNRTTPRIWILDLFKETLLGLALGVPVAYALLWFMRATGSHWWIYAFLFLVAFQLLVLYIYPAWISPLFNKFAPLSDSELADKLMQLAERLKFKLAGVYQMDGSKRSAHANAYFTGFGANKRIVLFDTLLATLDRDETLAVIAHEIGHQRLNHIKKMIALSFSMMLVGFWFLSVLAIYPPFFHAFGFPEPSNAVALILFGFASSPFSYFLSPMFASLSRKHEYEADHFACTSVGGAGPLVNGLLKLARKSLSNLTPHPLYSFFHYSHPTLHERLERLNSY